MTNYISLISFFSDIKIWIQKYPTWWNSIQFEPIIRIIYAKIFVITEKPLPIKKLFDLLFSRSSGREKFLITTIQLFPIFIRKFQNKIPSVWFFCPPSSQNKKKKFATLSFSEIVGRVFWFINMYNCVHENVIPRVKNTKRRRGKVDICV